MGGGAIMGKTQNGAQYYDMIRVMSWSITRVKEFNELNFKLNFELKIYKN